MTESTGEKKPAQGGLVGRCGSVVRDEFNDALSRCAHGGWVNKDRLAYFVLAGAAFFGLYGSLHSLAQARSLEAPSPPVEQIQVGFTDIVDAVAVGATESDQLAAHLVRDGVVLVATVAPERSPIASPEADQSGDGGKRPGEDGTARDRFIEAVLQAVISGCVGYMLGFMWGFWRRR